MTPVIFRPCPTVHLSEESSSTGCVVVEVATGRRCGDGAGMPPPFKELFSFSTYRSLEASSLQLVNPLYLNLTMSADPTFMHDHAGQSETPPIPTQMLSLAHCLLELDDEQQMRELLDSTLSQDCNIHHLSGAMVDAIRSNKVYLVKELLRRKLPISPLYVFEAVKAKAKEVLTIFFNS